MRYRVEWQLGGEFILETPDDGTASERSYEQLQAEIGRTLEGIAEDVHADVCEDVEGVVSSYSGLAEVTLTKL